MNGRSATSTGLHKRASIYPVLMSLVHWGDTYTTGKAGRPLLHQHLRCGHQFDPVLTCSECGEGLDPREVRVMPGPGADRKLRQFYAERIPPETASMPARATAPGRNSDRRRRSAV